MVRVSAISWTIGLAVLAAALPYGHSPALAADGQAEKAEPPPRPVEVKSVPVTLLPPANEALFAFKPARPANDGVVVSVPPTDKAAVAPAAPPRPEPAKVQENAAAAPAAPPRPAPAKVQEDAASFVTPPRPEPAKVKEDAVSLVAPPRPEPLKVQEDPPVIERSSLPEQPPQIASQRPAGNAASAQRRPKPARLKDATFTAIPSLPERRPFRPVLANIEPQEKQQNAPQPKSFFAKVNAAFQPLTDLWPGNRRTAEAAPPAAEGKSGWTASPAPANPGQASDNTEAKPESGSFLKKLRFW